MSTSLLSDSARAEHLRWLLELTSIPTAAGKERRIIDWIRRWALDRSDLVLVEDTAGNLVVRRREAGGAPTGTPRAPLFITAHLDHPAFVVERIIGPGTVQLSFRGGVNDPYFANAPRIVIHSSNGPIHAAIIEAKKAEPFRQCLADLMDAAPTPAGDRLPEVGDMATWHLPPAFTEEGLAHTPACDDLAAAAAALAAFDVLREKPDAAHVQLLFTRAEEIGFIGAIAACKLGTMPLGSRVLALENSRSFPLDSPIGAGPIVRVGDRLSTFSPALTAAVAKSAEKLAEQRKDSKSPFRWQRKLMAGGACEATCYQAYGYEATCICLPLGNYHNMADLERVAANDPAAVAKAAIASEHISISDYHAMIDLLIACGTTLENAEPIRDRMEKLHAKLGFVLEA